MLGVGRLGPCVAADAAANGPRSVEAPPSPRSGALPERDAWAVLAGVEGVGPVTFGRLVGRYGSAVAALDAAGRSGGIWELVEATSGPDGGTPTLTVTSALLVRDAAADPARHLEPIRRSGVEVLTLADGAYPARLRRIELPPPVLFVRGDVAALDRDHAVAVVGTRRPTTVGRATADRIADAVAVRGATIVSGLALGIDGAAHAAALRAATPTIAVIGGGHRRLYPSAHRGLATAIVRAGGAVVSEFAPDTQPSRGTFPRRNRLISGLADATVVVEAGARSGALTTAAWALEQGRQLYIVPGRLDDPAVAGSLAFLREAGSEAKVVAGIAELMEDLGLDGSDAGHPGLASVGIASLAATEGAVAAAVSRGLATVDELVVATGLSTAALLGALTLLEDRGLVIEIFGRYSPTARLRGPGSRSVGRGDRRGRRTGPPGHGR